MDGGKASALRTTTSNICTGGLYFELDLLDGVAAPDVNSRINVELTVPPGDGHFPYQGRVSSVAEVVRRESLPAGDPPAAPGHARLGIGARFTTPLKLVF